MKKPTVLELKHKKGARLAMLTAYDFPSARLVVEAGVDLILVGDSLGMVVLGYDSTVPVTMKWISCKQSASPAEAHSHTAKIILI